MALIGGAKTKFLVVCTARTGSNLLTRSLARPPDVRCFGELAKANYQSEPNAFAKLERLTGRGAQELAKLQSDTIEKFIFDIVYKIEGEAIGFKIFYEHCREATRAVLWDRLAAERALKVVHLTREAGFDVYVSLLYAELTNKWVTLRGDSDAQANDLDNIIVDIEHCRGSLQRHFNRRREATTMFGRHPYLEVDYNELEIDLSGTLRKVRGFLEVPQQEIDIAPLRKQAARPAREKVRNYAEVKAAFRGTDLASMFPSD
ncbi:MAG: sulfotransferase [Caulobacteraceae bacterium]